MFKTQPTLALDFVNGRQLDSRIKFSRSTSATRVNKLGVLETVGANVPRFDHEPADVLAPSVEYAVGAWIAPVGYDSVVTASGATVTSVGAATPNRCALLLREMKPGAEYTLQITVNSKTNGDPAFFIRDGATAGTGTTIFTGTMTELRKYTFSFAALTKNVNLLIANNDPTSSFDCTVSVVEAAKYLKRKGECKGLLIEEQRVNLIRNSSNVGATVGVIGSGGALPTNWTKGGGTGLNLEVVSVGTDAGVPYVDIGITGTSVGASSGLYLYVDGIGGATGLATGQSVAASIWTKINKKTLADAGIYSITLGVEERNSGAGYLQTGSSLTFNSSSNPYPTSLDRISVTKTLLNAATVRGNMMIFISTESGAAVDVVLRIGGAQFEVGSFPTSYIPTSGVTATRTSDQATMYSVEWVNNNEGTLVVTGSAEARAGTYPGIFNLYSNLTNYLIGFIDSNWSNWKIRRRKDSVDQYVSSPSAASLSRFAVAGSYTDSGMKISAGGNASTGVSSSGNQTGPVTAFKIGVADSFLNGHVRSITYFPVEMSHFEIKEISKAP